MESLRRWTSGLSTASTAAASTSATAAPLDGGFGGFFGDTLHALFVSLADEHAPAVEGLFDAPV